MTSHCQFTGMQPKRQWMSRQEDKYSLFCIKPLRSPPIPVLGTFPRQHNLSWYCIYVSQDAFTSRGSDA
eukprot:12936658-Prorocentrum_lima.AAC.1